MGLSTETAGRWDVPLERLFGSEALSEGTVPLVELLRAKRLLTIKDFVHLPAFELRDWLLITEDEATQLLSRAWAFCASPPVSAWELAARNQAVQRQRSRAPLPSLDRALGGLPAAILEVAGPPGVGKTQRQRSRAPLPSLVAGPPGVGKTQFCLHAAALTAITGGEVFWLDTERSFSAERLFEMLEQQLLQCRHGEAQQAAMAALQHVRHQACDSLQELHEIIVDLSRRSQVLPSLLVIDSVAAPARREGAVGPAATGSGKSMVRRQAALSSLASELKVLVTPRGEEAAPRVVVTNQVMGDPTSGAARVTLGHVWHHSVNWRLVLSHLPPGPGGPGSKEQADPFGRRYLLVEKSPCCETLTIPFSITEHGLNELKPQ